MFEDSTDRLDFARARAGAQGNICNLRVRRSSGVLSCAERFLKRKWAAVGDENRTPREAVRAVVVTSQHTERKRGRAGQNMVKWLFLSRIALQRGDITPGDAECAVSVEADLADTALAGEDDAPVAAGGALYLAASYRPG